MEISLVSLFVILFCLALAFFLSGMEAGVFALSRLRVRQLMKAGNSQARLLNAYLEEPESFLWTILIGNTAAGFIALSLIVLELYGRLGRYPVVLVVVLLGLTVVYYAVVDLLPKMLFRQFPNRLCLRLARPFRLIHIALLPFVQLVSQFANFLLLLTGGRTFTGSLFGDRNELRLIMQESSNVLSREERAIINRVLDLENLTVGSCCLPMDEVVTVQENSSVDEVLRICRDTGLNRIPVWRKFQNKNRIAGYVYLMPLLFTEPVPRHKRAADIARPAMHLKESTRLKDALRKMQAHGQPMAVVTGLDGKEKGIIKILDILRIIFGEVRL